MRIGIDAVHSYLPKTVKHLAQDYESFGLSLADTRIYNRFYGLDHIPCHEGPILDLLKAVAEPAIKAYQPDQIRYVIAARTAPVLSPIGISLVRDLTVTLGLKKATGFTVGMNKCVSTLRAFQVAEALLATGAPTDKALIVTGEAVFTEQNRVLPNITVTADGAAAALVSMKHPKQDHQMLSLSTHIDGEYAQGVWMPREKVSEFGGRFNAEIKNVIDKALAQAGIEMSQVTCLLPHNVNIPCWKGFAKFADIPVEKIYLKNIATNSHCFNSDLLMNLSSALADGFLKKGDYYLMVTVGVGAMFGAAVFRL